MKRHGIKCKINEEDYKQYGLVTEYYWIINGQVVNELKNSSVYYKYVTIENDNLFISSISMDTELDKEIREIFRDSVISCRVVIKSNNDKQAKIIFDSDKDNSLQNQLVAKMKMSDAQSKSIII